MSKFTLNATTRTDKGRSASRRLRRADRIPAVLYGKHTSPESLVVEAPEFKRLLKAIGGRAVLVELSREGHKEKALSFLQEVQRDPITDRYLHIDFHEVKGDEKLDIRVPVTLEGVSFGVKNQSGVIDITSHELHIRCLPKDLPATVSIDITPLKVGEMIKVSELPALEGVEFLDNEGQPVVICSEPVKEEEVVAPVETEEAPEAEAAEADAPAPAEDAEKK